MSGSMRAKLGYLIVLFVAIFFGIISVRFATTTSGKISGALSSAGLGAIVIIKIYEENNNEEV